MTLASPLQTSVCGVTLRGGAASVQPLVLTPEAQAFLADLARRFGPPLRELLGRRAARQEAWNAGARPDFLPETAAIRAGDWRVAPLPEDLQQRVVEITGPVDRKMIVNALNSGADVFMADFEDATSPTWENLVQGQRNLCEAVRGTLRHVDAETGKRYELHERRGVLVVRPRGLHLPERHFLVDGWPIPGALFDFGLYLFHNARELRARGTGPYFYLPKLESHLEARWWNAVFRHAQDRLGLPGGTIKATVLIETLPAAFEMDEILYELREHAAGLNCGRWDYIFSFSKCLREDPAAVLPDRAQVTMEQPFLRAYSQLLVRTCHRRGAFAMGGMAAQIPIKDDPERHHAALERVRADKLREAGDGHDGTWVAHPALVPLARAAFASRMSGGNQLHVRREDVQVGAADLLRVPQGERTEAGLRHNLRVGVQYLDAWLQGRGCVPLYHLMEDAATAEISRVQIWQWLRHGVALSDDRPVTRALVRQLLEEELAHLRAPVSAPARELFARLCTEETLTEFLTLPAYPLLP